jgi:hypothetical protein
MHPANYHHLFFLLKRMPRIIFHKSLNSHHSFTLIAIKLGDLIAFFKCSFLLLFCHMVLLFVIFYCIVRQCTDSCHDVNDGHKMETRSTQANGEAMNVGAGASLVDARTAATFASKKRCQHVVRTDGRHL